MAAGFARGRQGVATVTSLDQGVWTKTQAGFCGHDFVDDRWVFPVIDVVHQLGSLIAKKAGVLKLCRAFHDFLRY